MSHTVSFAQGTNPSGSPSKLFNNSAAHSSTKYDLSKRRGELRFNMHNKNTSIPYDDFMRRFVPSPSTRKSTRSARKSRFRNIFQEISTRKNEQDMYDTLPKTLNESKLCPGYTVVATPGKMDPADPTKQSVDLGMYLSGVAPKRPSDGSHARVNWSNLDLPIECKDSVTEEDPFDDNTADAEPLAEKRKAALGQILSYAELVFRYQQRKHLFMVDFLGNFVRLIRVDHSGLYVTHKFNYKQEGEKLAAFFWRYSRMTAGERGHDPTAVRIAHESALGRAMKKMAAPPKQQDERDYIREAFETSLDPNWPWWRLDVPVVEHEGTPEEKHSFRKFAVGKPHFQAPGVAGRATRGYVALPLSAKGTVKGPPVYLKDAWRVDRDGIEKEGSILQELNGLNTKYVPTLVCHGDLEGQVTLSQDLWKTYHPEETDECPLKRHQHYRLVVEQVGKPLDQFKNGYELVYALLCCIDAHQAAHNAGIIHRDISAGNMLLLYDAEEGWHGMLNDWELSKRVSASDAASGGRQPDRTGTWQFMSAHALNDRLRAIIVPDELESFLHVLLYYAIRYLPHNCPDSAVGKLLHLYFDDYTDDGDGQFNCGWMKFHAMKDGYIGILLVSGIRDKHGKNRVPKPTDELPLQFRLPNSTEDHPVQRIVATVLRWLAAYYALHKAKLSSSQSLDSRSDDDDSVELSKGLSAFAKKHLKQPANIPSSFTLEAWPSIPEAEELVKRKTVQDAKMLETHEQMLALITNEVIRRKNWPAEDKGEDKRPKKGYVHPKDPIAARSTQQTGTTGTNRRRTDQDPNPSTPKKRSKA